MSNLKTVEEIITDQLSDDYACTRVWEAWQVGTMTQDDFVLLTETERVDELKQAILQWVADEVVDKTTPKYRPQMDDWAGNAKYEMGDSQRQILKAHGWKES